jgi:putative membrane protein
MNGETDGSTCDSELRVEIPPTRLHPATLWLPIADALRVLVIGILVVVLFAGLVRTLVFVSLFLMLPFAAHQISRYLSFRYEIHGTDLILRSGLIWRWERRIPLRRVQDTRIEQGPFHQLLRLARLKVTTAGSEAHEASLEVISLDEAERVRNKILQYQNALSGTDKTGLTKVMPGQDLLLKLPLSTLVVGGLSSKLIASLGALIGAIVYFELVLRIGSRYLKGFAKLADPLSYMDPVIQRLIPASPEVEKALATADFVDRLMDRNWYFSLLRYFLDDSLGKAVFIILVGLTISVLGFAIQHFRYRLVRSGGVLTSSCGLMTSSTSSLVQDHVVALKVQEDLPRRWLRLASVAVDSGGDQTKADDGTKRKAFIPVLARPDIPRLVEAILPDVPQPESNWRHISRKAIMRQSKKGWLILLVLAILTHLAFGWFSLGWLAVVPLIYYLSLQAYLHTGYSVDARYVVSRKGWFNRETLYLPVRNLQSVAISENYFDRRLGLATLVLDTAGQTNTGGGASIRNLPVEDARNIQAALVRSVSRTKFIL